MSVLILVSCMNELYEIVMRLSMRYIYYMLFSYQSGYIMPQYIPCLVAE